MPANSAYLKYPMGEELSKLIGTLSSLPIDMQETIIAAGVAEGAKSVVQAAKNFAPRDTGALRASITSVVRKRKGTAVAVVGPSTSYYSGKKRLKKGASKEGASKPSRYAHLVEFGHLTQTGRHITGQPFMRPAAMVGATTAPAAIAAGIQKGLITSVKRAKRKGLI